MEPKQNIDIGSERIEEIRSLFEGIDGAQSKSWYLEVYDLVDGQDRLVEVIDIRTGKRSTTKPRKSKVTPYRSGI